jgi:hypothetical protein
LQLLFDFLLRYVLILPERRLPVLRIYTPIIGGPCFLV